MTEQRIEAKTLARRLRETARMFDGVDLRTGEPVHPTDDITMRTLLLQAALWIQATSEDYIPSRQYSFIRAAAAGDDPDFLRKCAKALVQEHKAIWPGSWPAMPEANRMAQAVLKAAVS